MKRRVVYDGTFRAFFYIVLFLLLLLPLPFPLYMLSISKLNSEKEMSATDWRSTEEYRQYASGPREVGIFKTKKNIENLFLKL